MARARIVLILSLAVPSCLALGACEERPTAAPDAGRAAAPAAPAPPRSPALAALEPAVQAYNRAALEQVGALFTEEHELVLPVSGSFPVKGRADLLALLKSVQLAFPDGQLRLRRVLDGGDVWAAELSFRGTHQADFLGVPATQKRVEIHFAVLSEVAGGRLTSSVVVGNALALLKQLQGDLDRQPPGPAVPEKPELAVGPGPAAQVEQVKAFFAAFDSGDLPALDRLVAEDVEVLALGDGKLLRGLPALRDTLVREREVFQGQVSVVHAFAAGPYTVAMVEVEGKIVGELGPLKASGKGFWEQGLDVFEHRGGKIKAWNNYRNLLDLLTQLGLYPPPAAAPSRPAQP